VNGRETKGDPERPETGVTTNQILIGVGLILVLAVGAQVLASRLRIPAIIVPAGFIAGALTSDVRERLLGPSPCRSRCLPLQELGYPREDVDVRVLRHERIHVAVTGEDLELGPVRV
jgi:hypothetical protein